MNYEDVIRQLYYQALVKNDVDACMELIMPFFDATDIHLVSHTSDYRNVVFNEICRNKSISEEVVERFFSPDRNPSIEFFKQNRGREFASDNDFGADPFSRYAEFYNYVDKMGGKFRIGHRYLRNESIDGAMWIIRDRKYGVANAQDYQKLAFFKPHLESIVELLQMQSNSGAAGKAVVDSLNDIGQAAFIVDAKLNVMQHNDRASEHLSMRDGVQRIGSRLHLREPEADCRLAECVAHASDKKGLDRGGSVIFRNSDDSTAYRLSALPLIDDPRLFVPARKFVLLVLSEIGGPSKEIGSDVAAFYGFSKAECHVASLILEGLGLSEIARRRNTSVETVKVQARSVRNKVGCERNVDLVRILSDF